MFCRFAVVVFSAVAAPSAGAQPADLSALLGRPLLRPGEALADVQSYAEPRIAPMPAAASAAEWEARADRLRRDVLERVVFRGVPPAWREGTARAEWQGEIPGGPGYRIRKLRYEALPGLWIPALLYEPEKPEGKVACLLNVNGHEGEGNAAKNKQVRAANIAKRGMLALNLEWLGMGQLRAPGFSHARMNQLDLCGTSGLAPFLLAMQRGLDVLLAHPNADPARVAVTGHSGGGWQSVFVASLDRRVTLAVPVAGHSSLRNRILTVRDLGDSEQVPCDLAAVADYTHLTALVAPRPLLLTYCAKDECCFQPADALPPLLAAARPVYRLFGAEHRLRWHINIDPGTHNYERDNREAFYRMLHDHFFGGDPAFDPREIACDGEVKPEKDLKVDLPEPNTDFHSLALALSRSLPRHPDLPAGKAAAEAWQTVRREELRGLVRARMWDVRAEDAGEAGAAGVIVRFRRLRIGGAWTAPATELGSATPGSGPPAISLLVSDSGRAGAAKEAERLLAAGKRVLALDPFYIGECRLNDGGYQFAMVVDSVGDRALGVQAGQLTAVARWARAEHKGAVEIVAVGPRMGLAALAAAALEPEAVAGVEVRRPLGSLREVIEGDRTLNEMPELFCFGLLEAFDVRQIAALAAPRPVRFHEAGDRAKAELAALREWYARWGVPWDPLADKNTLTLPSFPVILSPPLS